MKNLRKKKKIIGNVDVADPLEVELPEALIMHKGESMLLYDSRDVRPGEPDVVLVFAHPQVDIYFFGKFNAF